MRPCLLGIALVLAGCAGQKQPDPDALTVVRDVEEHVNVRTAALERAWDESRTGASDPVAVRDETKDLLWDPAAPTELRLAAYRGLLTDQSDEARDDVRRFTALRLPTEPAMALIVEMCAAAMERGWEDVTSSLVRSYSRPFTGIADADRPEHRAIQLLHPDDSVLRVAFEVFLDPEVVAGDGVAERQGRARADTWDLLGRLDPDGRERMRWVDEASENPRTRVITWSAQELGAIPITGDELRWLDQLLETRSDLDGWWQETSAAVRELPPGASDGLRLRHLEPIRWAAANRSDLLGQSRDQLLAELEERARGQRHHRRFAIDSAEGPTRDRLDEWSSRLSWADLLVLRVIDDAIRQPNVVQMLFAQAAMDRADDTTEYGGVLAAGDGRFVARMYTPRPASRRGDDQFIASADMMAHSAVSYAHYHFHAQEWRNAEYAGPSKGDLAYATQHGRTCIVFTSIEEGVLGVDVLQPGGIAVDLGEIRR